MMELTTREQRQLQHYQQHFQTEYGNAHYLFACHAAFPVVFTVDLLHQLWRNFKNIQQPPLPKEVISDFLLSNLCQEVGLGLYEFRDTNIRKALLEDLEEQFGSDYIKRLAAFLYQYADKNYKSKDFQNIKDTHQWTALAKLNPQEAMQKIGDVISKVVVNNDKDEKLRVHSLLEELVKFDPIFKDLSEVSRSLYEDVIGNKNYIPTLSRKKDNSFLLEIILPTQLKEILDVENISDELKQLILEVKNGKTTYLRFNRKGLTQIPEEIFELETLEHLELFGNAITKIPKDIVKLKNLRNLYLSVNPISEIPDYIFELTNLQAIRISDAQIKVIPKSIERVTRLKELHLSQNKLIEIPLFLMNIKSLEYLNLSFNQIEFFPFDVVTSLSKLKYIELYQNPIKNLPKEIIELTNSIHELKSYIEKIENNFNRHIENVYIRYFNELIKILMKHYPTVGNYIIKDIVSETFLIYINQMKSNNYNKPDDIKLYLYTISKYRVLNYLNQNNKRASNEAEYLTYLTNIHFSENNKDTYKTYSEMIEEVLPIIRAFDKVSAGIFELRFAEGLSTKEIARLLETNESFVKHNVSKTIEKLKQIIQDDLIR